MQNEPSAYLCNMKRIIFLAALLPFAILLPGCSNKPAENKQAAEVQHMPDTAEFITNPAMVANGLKNHALADTVTDAGKNKIVILYNPAATQKDYTAEHYSGVADTSAYAKDRGTDKGQVYFPCTDKTIHDYKIEKRKILSVVSVLNDTEFDRTDYIFMRDTIVQVEIWSANAGIFINSDIKFIANSITSAGKAEYDVNPGSKCSFSADYFSRVLHFCQRNNIKVH